MSTKKSVVKPDATSETQHEEPVDPVLLKFLAGSKGRSGLVQRMRFVLGKQFAKEPDLAAAVECAVLALERLAGDTSVQPSILAMATALDPYATSPQARVYARITRVFRYSAPRFESTAAEPKRSASPEWIDEIRHTRDELGRLPEELRRLHKEITSIRWLSDEEQLADRVAHFREELVKLDPRLELAERAATRVVELHARADGAAGLAAHWAWLSGFETPGNKPRVGRPPASFIQRFQRDAAKTRAARKKRPPR